MGFLRGGTSHGMTHAWLTYFFLLILWVSSLDKITAEFYKKVEMEASNT